ncbi:hypothetical protein ACSBR2_043050 [Camellia fascicularis]
MLISRQVSSNRWCFNFRRTVHAWEEEEVVRLTDRLGAGPRLSMDLEEHVRWKADRVGGFKVSNVYKWGDLESGPTLTAAGLIWNNFSPPGAKFFTWLAWKGRLKTTVYLNRIGVLRSSVDLSCVFCKSELESVTHLLLLCPFVWQIWACIIDWWGLSWATLGSVDCLFNWWMSWKFRKKERPVWRAIPSAVVWSVWKCRNECIFSNKPPLLEESCELIKVRLALWLKTFDPGCSYFVGDIVWTIHLFSCIGNWMCICSCGSATVIFLSWALVGFLADVDAAIAILLFLMIMLR